MSQQKKEEPDKIETTVLVQLLRVDNDKICIDFTNKGWNKMFFY